MAVEYIVQLLHDERAGRLRAEVAHDRRGRVARALLRRRDQPATTVVHIPHQRRPVDGARESGSPPADETAGRASRPAA